MDDIQLDELIQLWSDADRLKFVRDAHGLVYAAISNGACTAQMYLHGAHVTHFQPRDCQPVLFMSGASKFAAGAPIRGGVPICFPWFGPHETDPTIPAHGYARTAQWQLVSAKSAPGSTVIEMRLPNDNFFAEVSFRVTFTEELRMEYRVLNTRDATVRFELALHSYLQVSNVQEVSIAGLENTPYFDQLQSVDCPASQRPIVFAQETDRIYFNAPNRVTLCDASAQRQIIVERDGVGSFVIWNPWIKKARRMADFGDDEWTSMCCIESSAVRRNAVKLRAGESKRFVAVHRVEPLR